MPHAGDAQVQWPTGGSSQFRGRRVRDAVISQLLQLRGLGAATDVLITGDSAGGVAALNSAAAIKQITGPLTPK